MLKNRMKFPEGYFDDEVRDGFYVNGMMKRCWAAQIEVLTIIAGICEKHGIRWYADCGTLLGAVRHGGFIPWDDDLDICMMRDDYNRFLKAAKDELPEGYAIRDYHDPDCWDLLLRVNNSLYLNFDDERLKQYHGFPFISGIDIFPLDFVPADPEEEENWKTISRYVFYLTANDDLESGNRMSRETGNALREVEKLCGTRIDRKRPIKLQLYELLTGLFSAYGRENAKEIVLTPYWLHDGSHRYPLEWFRETAMLPFENTFVPAPAVYNEVLRTEYGEGFMRPVHAGGVHGYPYYEDQERMLKEANQGFYPYWHQYEGTRKEVPEQMGKRLRDKAEEMVSLMGKAHEQILTDLQSGNREAAAELLIQCQNMAIQIGTQIEKALGEGTEMVRELESYCEEVYRIYEEVSQKKEEKLSRIESQLKDRKDRISESIRKEISGKKEVLFLPWKSSTWDAMRYSWQRAKEDPECRVFVVPLPYYDKKPDNSFGELHYEGDDFPEEAEALHYDSYDIPSRLPDVIVIQNPYDGCNYTSSVHPFYYAKNLKQYTDHLVYVPWFTIDEIQPGDERSKKSMEHFVSVPGVEYADEVILPSERMKRTYVEFLTEWAGEETREMWENKITWRQEREDAKTAPDDRQSKALLYYVSISSLLEHKERMLKKMEEVFRVFLEQRDKLRVFFCPDPEIERLLPKARPELYESYLEMLSRIPWNDSLTREAGIKEAAEECDAFYGDPCSIVQSFLRRSLPVMVQNPEV